EEVFAPFKAQLALAEEASLKPRCALEISSMSGAEWSRFPDGMTQLVALLSARAHMHLRAGRAGSAEKDILTALAILRLTAEDIYLLTDELPIGLWKPLPSVIAASLPKMSAPALRKLEEALDAIPDPDLEFVAKVQAVADFYDFYLRLVKSDE